MLATDFRCSCVLCAGSLLPPFRTNRPLETPYCSSIPPPCPLSLHTSSPLPPHPGSSSFCHLLLASSVTFVSASLFLFCFLSRASPPHSFGPRLDSFLCKYQHSSLLLLLVCCISVSITVCTFHLYSILPPGLPSPVFSFFLLFFLLFFFISPSPPVFLFFFSRNAATCIIYFVL